MWRRIWTGIYHRETAKRSEVWDWYAVSHVPPDLIIDMSHVTKLMSLSWLKSWILNCFFPFSVQSEYDFKFLNMWKRGCFIMTDLLSYGPSLCGSGILSHNNVTIFSGHYTSIGEGVCPYHGKDRDIVFYSIYLSKQHVMSCYQLANKSNFLTGQLIWTDCVKYRPHV